MELRLLSACGQHLSLPGSYQEQLCAIVAYKHLELLCNWFGLVVLLVSKSLWSRLLGC